MPQNKKKNKRRPLSILTKKAVLHPQNGFFSPNTEGVKFVIQSYEIVQERIILL